MEKLWATLPSSSAVRSPRPWEPITITPAWQALAVSTMVGATRPSTASSWVPASATSFVRGVAALA